MSCNSLNDNVPSSHSESRRSLWLSKACPPTTNRQKSSRQKSLSEKRSGTWIGKMALPRPRYGHLDSSHLKTATKQSSLLEFFGRHSYLKDDDLRVKTAASGSKCPTDSVAFSNMHNHPKEDEGLQNNSTSRKLYSYQQSQVLGQDQHLSRMQHHKVDGTLNFQDNSFDVCTATLNEINGKLGPTCTAVDWLEDMPEQDSEVYCRSLRCFSSNKENMRCCTSDRKHSEDCYGGQSTLDSDKCVGNVSQAKKRCLKLSFTDSPAECQSLYSGFQEKNNFEANDKLLDKSISQDRKCSPSYNLFAEEECSELTFSESQTGKLFLKSQDRKLTSLDNEEENCDSKRGIRTVELSDHSLEKTSSENLQLFLPSVNNIPQTGDFYSGLFDLSDSNATSTQRVPSIETSRDLLCEHKIHRSLDENISSVFQSSEKNEDNSPSTLSFLNGSQNTTSLETSWSWAHTKHSDFSQRFSGDTQFQQRKKAYEIELGTLTFTQSQGEIEKSAV